MLLGSMFFLGVFMPVGYNISCNF